MKIRCISAAVGIAALLAGGMAGTAQAKPPIDPVDHYSGTRSEDFTDCGLALHAEISFSGMSFIRPAPGSDEAFLLHDRYRFTETITLQESDPDGPYVTTVGSGNFVETRARLLDPAEPTIYQFWTVDAGTFRLYSSTGELLVSSSGVIKGSNVQDTLGDKEPGSRLISEVGDFHGHESGDFCEAVMAELT